jgi:predicted 3-demethylubiquinone-9 3-methyltransferase (glyoxalase superfamily)
MSLPADSAIGPAGAVVTVEFTLFGQSFMAMSAGANDRFHEATSFE